MYEILSFWEIAWILYSIGSLVVVIAATYHDLNKYKSNQCITLDDVTTLILLASCSWATVFIYTFIAIEEIDSIKSFMSFEIISWKDKPEMYAEDGKKERKPSKKKKRKDIKEIKMQLPENMLVYMKFGSHLYGTNTPDSDEDFKGVAMPSCEDILMGRIPANIVNTSTGRKHAKNSKEDTDVEIMSLHQFIKLALEGQMVAFDMLYAPEDWLISTSPIWKAIVSMRSSFSSKNTYAFVSYIRKQVAKYGMKGSRLNAAEELINICKKYPDGTRLGDIVESEGFTNREHMRIMQPGDEGNIMTRTDQPEIAMLSCCGRKFHFTCRSGMVIESMRKFYDSYGKRAKLAAENKGIDWKAVSHAFRTMYQMKELFTRGSITFPNPQAQKLTDIKCGKLQYTALAEELEDELVKLEIMRDNSEFPDQPDVNFINARLRDWTMQHLTSEELKKYKDAYFNRVGEG